MGGLDAGKDAPMGIMEQITVDTNGGLVSVWGRGKTPEGDYATD
jgi:hypothetical protein